MSELEIPAHLPDLTGKTALITGASRGIGAAAARVFVARGANVVLAARSGDAISALAAELGEKALAIPCDVADPEAVAAMVAQTETHFGALDILIIYAGMIEPIARLEDSDPAGWGAVIDINLKGVYFGIRAALPGMKTRGGGTIITISSGAANNAIEGWSHYCASKAAAKMLTAMVHKEEGDAGIRSLGLSPGTVATEMQREIKASGINPVSQLDWSDHIPSEWPAMALLWMCGPEADDWLGQDISLRDESIRRDVGLIA